MTMKVPFRHILCLACCGMALISKPANLQAQNEAGLFTLHKGYNERYAVVTDRNMYCAGETIRFVVVNLTGREVRKAIDSRIYYMELLKGDGTPVAGAKFLLTPEGAEGTFPIPGNIATGYYFLRSYTRWMRNFSPADFSYNRITIINPHMQGMDEPVADIQDPLNGIGTPGDTTAVLQMPVSCSTDKTLYGNREKAVISIGIPAFLKAVDERYYISVTRPGVSGAGNAGIVRLKDPSPDGLYFLQYLPESAGLSISGKILYKENGKAAKNAFVQLSMLHEDGDYLSYYTGEDGKFHFSLNPYSGKQDFFISARAASEGPVELLIDRDFANQYEALVRAPFRMSPGERSLAEEMMINSQINQSYHMNSADSSDRPDKIDSTGISFYGKPIRTVYIDEFIALPTLGEVFFELVPEISIVKRKGNPYMVMTGHARNNADLASYNPLVLIDRVPVSSLADLLEVSPQKIQRIELINNIYVKGDIIYGGIVSIFSKKGDLGGINLPANSSFYVFSGFNPRQAGNDGEGDRPEDKARIPDFRNCLYWNPSVFIKPGSTASLEFCTSDSKGDFEVVIRALTPQGEVMEKRCTFTVK